MTTTQTTKTLTTYTTTGSVRGGCGHAHRSIRTAHACLQRDQAGCSSQGGYSDRSIARTGGEPLSDYELDELQEVEDTARWGRPGPVCW